MGSAARSGASWLHSFRAGAEGLYRPGKGEGARGLVPHRPALGDGAAQPDEESGQFRPEEVRLATCGFCRRGQSGPARHDPCIPPHLTEGSMTDKYKGSCFCGAVEIEVTGAPAAMGYCHCRSCRHWSAGPVNAFTLWPPESVKITKGK